MVLSLCSPQDQAFVLQEHCHTLEPNLSLILYTYHQAICFLFSYYLGIQLFHKYTLMVYSVHVFSQNCLVYHIAMSQLTRYPFSGITGPFNDFLYGLLQISSLPYWSCFFLQYLDENKQLILAILENQNLGKLAECAQYVTCSILLSCFSIWYDRSLN